MLCECGKEILDEEVCPICCFDDEDVIFIQLLREADYPLPELTEEERASIDNLPKGFINRILRGERPLTDPTTFAN